MSTRPILIVDALNAFLRSWAAYPQMNSNGEHIGGTIGFLKTLQRLATECSPSAIYIAWEGGGSTKRRALFSEYKMNRKAEKLNRFYEDDIPDTDENKKHQIVLLLNMLKCAPACQLYAADCEGDDVIAYLCRGPFKDHNKIIASSDKDLYQLLDDRTMQYSLHKKTFVTPQTVFEEFRVTSSNFAIAKALCGDSGDNVPGIKGFGFKKVAKLYPQLGTDDDILLQDILDYTQSHRDESKMYQRVIDQWDDVRRNWKLVYLDGGMLAQDQVARINRTIDTFEPSVNKMKLMKYLINEGVSDFDIEGFFYAFNGIDGLEYR